MRAFVAATLLVASGGAFAQDDVFSFIPEGGKTILTGLLDLDPALKETLATVRASEDWQAFLASTDNAAVTGLDDWQRQTLADYLAYAGAIQDTSQLPWDGRDMTLERCQSCHIVTVVVTQSRTRDAWLGTMSKPSHVKVPLSEAERGQLADYLFVNAGLPIDAIPPALRAGGASY